jgi:hypothetical protein
VVKRVISQLVLCLLALTPLSALAEGPATVAGTVRDAQGQSQIGVLVQLLSKNNEVLAAAYTDRDGHYDIRTIYTGVFQVRASAAMFLPTVRQNVPIEMGAHTLVDLTLNTLTEALQWLPAQPRTASEPADDWKWTLRSPSNRPILRIVDGGREDGGTITAELPSGDRPRAAMHNQVRAAVMNQSAVFGQSGVHQLITLDHTTAKDHEFLFRTDVVPAGAQATSSTMVTQFEQVPGQTTHMAANYQWHSGLAGGSANSPGTLGSANLRFAQTSQLGPGLKAEVGNELEEVAWGEHVVAAHPFASFTLAPGGSVNLVYALSTAPGFASAEDADGTIERTPLAAPSARGLELEHGLHQSLSWTRDSGVTTLRISYFHDNVDDPIGQGLGTAGALQSSGITAGLDPASGVFREVFPSFTTQGVEMSASHQFGQVTASVTFEDANALSLSAASTATTPVTHTANAQLATVSLRGMVTATHTRWSASYGAESNGVLVPLDAFSLDGPAPYMNVFLRQQLHGGAGGNNLEAIIEVRNLLAQGYHPFLSPDGETLYLVQVPRSVQGGLVFSF